jgi:mono/diheme cytochrome c family protein
MATDIGRIALGAAATLLAALAPAQSPDKGGYDATSAVMGAATFKTYCASCHGSTAKGDGPLADQLRYIPADLTRIARRNRGSFPFEKVARIIDGREPVKGHGGTDMPVWGDAFRYSREASDDAKIKAKINELVQYLASVQEEAVR